MNAMIKLAKSDRININYILKMSRRANHCYKHYTIPKASGEPRDIYQPSRKLKILQRWINRKVLSYFRIHKSATAYKKDTNITKNAYLHKENCYLLRMDFQNFFESITVNDFKAKLQPPTTINNLQFDIEDVEVLGKLLFKDSRLTIGAPSSPILSNILMFNFDAHIHQFCIQKEVVYSRYADDLFFSTCQPNVLNGIESYLYHYIKSLPLPRSLYINSKKTVHSSAKGRRHVTGLILTSDNQISIGRANKRKIKANIHKASLGKLDNDALSSLRGYLAFIQDVEPSFLRSLITKYGHEIIELIYQGRALR